MQLIPECSQFWRPLKNFFNDPRWQRGWRWTSWIVTNRNEKGWIETDKPLISRREGGEGRLQAARVATRRRCTRHGETFISKCLAGRDGCIGTRLAFSSHRERRTVLINGVVLSEHLLHGGSLGQPWRVVRWNHACQRMFAHVRLINAI